MSSSIDVKAEIQEGVLMLVGGLGIIAVIMYMMGVVRVL